MNVPSMIMMIRIGYFRNECGALFLYDKDNNSMIMIIMIAHFRIRKFLVLLIDLNRVLDVFVSIYSSRSLVKMIDVLVSNEFFRCHLVDASFLCLFANARQCQFVAVLEVVVE